MKAELNRKSLETLVIGSRPNYNIWNHELVLFAGYKHYDLGGSVWESLHNLSDQELYDLHIICQKSWEKQIINESNINNSGI